MDFPSEIIKRDGAVVPFNVEHIRESIKKAMFSRSIYDKTKTEKVVIEVVKKVNEIYSGTRPTVEGVQDIIEVELMKENLFDVAKEFILYRNKKKELREEKKKILNKDSLDEVDKSFTLNSLKLLASRYLTKNEHGQVIETPSDLFKRVAISIAIPEIFYDSRVFVKRGTPKRLDEVELEIKKYLDNLDEYDGKYFLNGWKINKWHFERIIFIYKELALKGNMKINFDEILERLENRHFEKADLFANDIYNLIVEKDFLPNSPTLINAGKKLGMLSACFTLDVDDNLDSIMKLARDCAVIHKSGGGTGMNFSKIRPNGDTINSSQGIASGPISFMKISDSISEVVKQGGVRRGANMGILEVWHPDVEEFIISKNKQGMFENFNISVGITKEFWSAFENDDDFELINPRNNEIKKKINARKFFSKLANSAWNSAEPGVLFFDNINRNNVLIPAKGEVRVTNPCGEEPLYPYESCNLASINLENFVKKDDENYVFDWDRFEDVVSIVTRGLDNIITVNKYPIPEIEIETKKTRRIGLGVMGLANALYKMKIKYNSEKGFEFMKKISENLTYNAYKKSIELSKERGEFELFKQTNYVNGELPIEGYYKEKDWTCNWDRLVSEIKINGLRNAMVTTAAPTGSISMIVDTSSGIEPVFSISFEKKVSVGSFFYVNSVFSEEIDKYKLKREEILKLISNNSGNLRNVSGDLIPGELKEVFVTSMDIHWLDHIVAQSVMQEWITDSISKTINMPKFVSSEDVECAYVLAHELNCKGVTIYRDESRSEQVLHVDSSNKEEYEIKPSEYSLKLVNNLIQRKSYIKEYATFFVEDKKTVDGKMKSEIEAEIISSTIDYYSPSKSKLKLIEEEKMAPIIKGMKGAKELCPSCYGVHVTYESGCMACKDCGWSACTIS